MIWNNKKKIERVKKNCKTDANSPEYARFSAHELYASCWLGIIEFCTFWKLKEWNIRQNFASEIFSLVHLNFAHKKVVKSTLYTKTVSNRSWLDFIFKTIHLFCFNEMTWVYKLFQNNLNKLHFVPLFVNTFGYFTSDIFIISESNGVGG
jgi:hypothetical protein